MNMINKDTKLYGSFSDNPGNNGCLFFNEAFKNKNINAIYKSFYSTDIEKTIISVKHLKFSGFALSMPLKIMIYDFLDEYDESVINIGACNTVVIDNDKLYGYNTDWVGVYKFFENKNFNHVNIIGTGGFAKAIMYAFSKLSINFSILSRKDIPFIDDVQHQYFINATPADILSEKNTIIDVRQFKIYTGIDYESD